MLFYGNVKNVKDITALNVQKNAKLTIVMRLMLKLILNVQKDMDL